MSSYSIQGNNVKISSTVVEHLTQNYKDRGLDPCPWHQEIENVKFNAFCETLKFPSILEHTHTHTHIYI
jgi:hypothetical protein